MKPMHVMLRIGLLLCLCASGSLYAQDTNTQDTIAAVMAASQPQIIQTYPAPDGAQRAEVTVYPCVNIGDHEAAYERLDLIDNPSGEARLVAQQVINCGGLGAFGLWVRRWSEDGAYLYYTDAREGSPDGMVGSWVPPLWRVRMADLQVEPLGPAQFSPDGTLLAAWDQAQVRVLPVAADGNAASFALLPADLQLAQVTWLPDSKGLLYIQADTLFGPVTRSTVTHIDLETSEQAVLLDG